MLQLTQSVNSLRMIGPSYLTRLKKLGIETIGDLLYHLPFRYENYSLISKIAGLQEGEKVTVVGQISAIKNIYTRRGTKLQKARISDETGSIGVIWYNQPFLTRVLPEGTGVSLAGEVKLFGHKLTFASPDYEVIKNPAQNSQPATNNSQPTTNNPQLTTNNSQPTTHNQPPTTNNSQPTTNNQPPTTHNSFTQAVWSRSILRLPDLHPNG